MFIHNARNTTVYIRNPLGNRFSIFLLQILNIKVCQMWVFAFGSHPADHFGLLEVYNFSSTVVAIDCGAPLFVGLKINQPYFLIGTVWYYNLFRTDHLNNNLKSIYAFHDLSEQGFSLSIGVEKHSPFSKISEVLLCLICHQKHKCVVQSFIDVVNKVNKSAFIFEFNGKYFLLKHQNKYQ